MLIGGGVQEEDFVTHLYNRNLLTSVSEEIVLHLLDEATRWLAKVDVAQPQGIKEALTHRLSLRKAFLESLAHALRPTVSAGWAKCNELLESVKSTAHLGIWVPDAFSAKLQRKLASTLPPRAMVNLDLSSALAFFKRLCQDSYNVYALQKPYGSNELKVKHPPRALPKPALTRVLDCRRSSGSYSYESRSLRCTYERCCSLW